MPLYKNGQPVPDEQDQQNAPQIDMAMARGIQNIFNPPQPAQPAAQPQQAPATDDANKAKARALAEIASNFFEKMKNE